MWIFSNCVQINDFERVGILLLCHWISTLFLMLYVHFYFLYRNWYWDSKNLNISTSNINYFWFYTCYCYICFLVYCTNVKLVGIIHWFTWTMIFILVGSVTILSMLYPKEIHYLSRSSYLVVGSSISVYSYHKKIIYSVH